MLLNNSASVPNSSLPAIGMRCEKSPPAIDLPPAMIRSRGRLMRPAVIAAANAKAISRSGPPASRIVLAVPKESSAEVAKPASNACSVSTSAAAVPRICAVSLLPAGATTPLRLLPTLSCRSPIRVRRSATSPSISLASSVSRRA
jgi:hypothetical protein